MLASSGSRALGSVLNKYFAVDGLQYATFYKLYSMCVCPVLDYASEVWGFADFPKIDTVQNRAQRVFLGVHNLTPTAAVSADLGWTPSRIRRQVSMIRFWNKVIAMPDYRLTKQVFIWDRSFKRQNWNANVKKLFIEMGCVEKYENVVHMQPSLAWALLYDNFCKKWSDTVNLSAKLRTFKIFKKVPRTESYVLLPNRELRSVIARFRTGVLPLEIETGRWRGVPENERLSKMCNCNEIENEIHFILYCHFYQKERFAFFNQLKKLNDFLNFSDTVKLTFLMSDEIIVKTGKFILEIFLKRKRHLQK